MNPFLSSIAIVVVILVTLNAVTRAPIRCNPAELSTSDTPETLRAKCGKPGRINASTGRSQWVYDDGFPFLGGTYIYLYNGHFQDAQWHE